MEVECRAMRSLWNFIDGVDNTRYSVHSRNALSKFDFPAKRCLLTISSDHVQLILNLCTAPGFIYPVCIHVHGGPDCYISVPARPGQNCNMSVVVTLCCTFFFRRFSGLLSPAAGF